MKLKLRDGKEIETNSSIGSDIIKEISSSLYKSAFYIKNNGANKNLFDKINEGEFEVINNVDEVSNAMINETAGLKIIKNFRKDSNYELLNFEVNDEEFLIDLKVENNISQGDLEKKIKQIAQISLESSDLLNENSIIISQVKFIKIISLSGIVHKNKVNRIKGFGAISIQDLEKREAEIKERSERDHRKIGKELEIFMIDEIFGKGLPIWLPNGVILKNKIKEFIFEKENEYGYIQVETPVLGSLEFYKKSGHYYHYKNSMFPVMEIEENEEYILRPMACPHHCLIYKSKPRSYRELPYKIAEQVKQYRYEASGALLGLERVRAMELTDSHIFLKMDQLENQLKEVFQLIQETLNKFEIKIKFLELALHDPDDKEKYHGDIDFWNKSENILRNFLKSQNIEFIEKRGEAAFYGPKIDIQIETALKHIITVSTIQLDFYLPEKFDLNYIEKDGSLQKVIMIHRGLIGTYERFISVLLEQTKGNLPMWIAPRQAVVIPINEKIHKQYAEKVNKILRDNKIRSELDLSDERISYKIRKYQKDKVKVQIIIGDEEIKNNTITYRYYGEEVSNTISIDQILKIFN